MKINLFKLIISYFIKHKKTVLLFCTYALICLFVFYLYKLPLESVLYSSAIFLTIFIVFAIYDIVNYYKRHKLLTELMLNIHISIDELPLPKDLWEKDYQDLIRAVHDEKISIISKSDNKLSSLNEYYTMWVHQIKTPISAMSLLLQSDINKQNDGLLSELFKIEQYVEMVLQYIRLNSSSSDFVFKRYPLDGIIKTAIKKYSKIFIKKKISLNFTETNYNALTDEKWLSFVIEQLLSNALKYTHNGSISIYMKPLDNLIIEDTGIGIASEDLPRVFEQGYTGYNGRIDKKSTGIGLFLCKSIIDKLSHTISIESHEGIGTKVIINLSKL